MSDIRVERANLMNQARALHESAGKRGLSAAQNAQFDSLIDAADRLKVEIDAEDRALIDRAAKIVTSGERWQSRALQRVNLDKPEFADLAKTNTPTYHRDYMDWLATGSQTRALQADVDPSGGYLVTPMELLDTVLAAVDAMVYMRNWATTFSVPTAMSLGVPTLANDISDSDWTTELGTGSEDETMSFGRRELVPQALAKRIKISNTLLRRATNVDQIVADRLSAVFAATQEKAFIMGTGTGQPLGVFTVSANGIDTDRDVSTSNTTTEVTADGLVEAKYALASKYWGGAKWLLHQESQKQIALLKDTEGNYIWRESVRAGEPDRLLGLPVFMSEYAPYTYIADAYVAVLGDFSKYWIADALTMTIQRLSELYAETNQTGLIARMESDGQPVLPEAFVRVQLASA